MSQGQEKSEHGKSRGRISRRGFIAGAGATALSFTIVKPESVRGSEANSKINLGVIGCGGRGKWITELFVKHGGYNIAAAADYFQDRADALGEKFGVDRSSRYSKLSGYQRLLEQKGIDAVAIESPPYFHPEQAAAGIEAGCHVYVAKPIAVDVPGCNTIEASGKKATGKKLCFLIDFQTRANEFYKKAVKVVHDGGIGKIAFGEASYHAGCPWKGQFKFLEDNPSDPENRLHAWGLDRILSGDIITEQNIHALDVASWMMNQPPLFAAGTGGRKVRTDLGNCWDHFALVFQYADNVGITFSSRQFNGHGSRGGIRNRLFGSKGVIETEYGGTVIVRGENLYQGGKTEGIFGEGAENNIAQFHKNITSGNFANETVPESVRSNLVTILGRTAAYTGEKVYWDSIIRSTEKLEADLRGLKA
ncbi:MAG: Gfo/Idh/MocA family protein [Planctomycetota bacterium]